MSQLVSESDPDFETLATPQVRTAIQAAHTALMKSPDELEIQSRQVGLLKTVRAKFKIEVTFTKGRTPKGPNVVGIQVWESGRRLHGGGDDRSFICRSTLSNEGCLNIITSDNIRGGVAFCPHCKLAINAQLLTGMMGGNYRTTVLAEELELLFHKLDNSADIYLKYHETDVRYLAMLRAKGAVIARRLKGTHIYELKNILKDTMAGASLQKRFAAFLSS